MTGDMIPGTQEQKFAALHSLYDSIPPTQCTKTSCADWCCSRLPSAIDGKGNFISLPLVYSIEFLHIQDYVLKTFPKEDIAEFYDYGSKKPLCCFKDRGGPGCRIYPVRPFTCRVFGRRVPPVFWGIDYPSEASERIFCPDLRVLDPQSEKKFQDRFPAYWQTLAGLSASVSVFTEEQLGAIRDASGMKDIYIAGWKEFAFLSKATPAWLRKNFAEFWNVHGSLL
jgi:Fe-S-cluster containining protein